MEFSKVNLQNLRITWCAELFDGLADLRILHATLKHLIGAPQVDFAICTQDSGDKATTSNSMRHKLKLLEGGFDLNINLVIILFVAELVCFAWQKCAPHEEPVIRCQKS
jgi:hypothetical protein